MEIKYDDLIEGYADEVSLVSDVFDNLFGAPMKCISKQQAPQVSGGTYQINIYFQLLEAKLEIYYGRSVYRRTFSGHYKVSYGYIDKTRQPSIGSRLTGAIRYLMENAQDQTELGLSAHEIGQSENHYQAHFYAMGRN